MPTSGDDNENKHHVMMHDYGDINNRADDRDGGPNGMRAILAMIVPIIMTISMNNADDHYDNYGKQWRRRQQW